MVIHLGGRDGDTCYFQKVVGKKIETISTTDEKTDEISKPKEKEIAARKTKMGYALSTATVSDITIFWKVTPGNAENENPLATLEVGVHSLDKKRSATSIKVEMSHSVEIHPDTIQISPDGKFLAVLVHGYFGEYSDQHELKIVSIDVLKALVLLQ